jgi:aspartyl-tRNA synthetase
LKRGRTEDQNSVIEIRSKDLANKINKRNRLANLLAVLRTEKTGALRVANVTESTTEVHREYLWPSKQKTLSQIVVAAEIFCI